MLIAQDEIFGLVQSILKFRWVKTSSPICITSFRIVSFKWICWSPSIRDINDAIRRANTTRYGLATGVFTKSVETANTAMRALRAGTVWINCYDVFNVAIPFGGYQMSGIGKEKGIYSLHNYLQVKAVVSPLKNPAWL